MLGLVAWILPGFSISGFFPVLFGWLVMSLTGWFLNRLGNCGVMTKIQWNDQDQGVGLPRCIECQGDPQQGMGQIWSLGATGGRPWVTIRAENHGKDTSRHFVDGQKVMEYWSPRIATTTNANAVSKYLTEGMVSIQSEGTTVWYRNWRVDYVCLRW